LRLTGTWVGQYTYGAGYGGIAGMSVPFTLSLTETWLGKVSGYVRDDATRGGMPERGRILGKRRKLEFEFVKTMPNHYTTSPDRQLVDLRLQLRQDHGLELPAELPPHRIHYRGAIHADGMSITGEWRIVPWRVELAQGAAEMGQGQGTWTAKRTSDLASSV